MATKFLPCLVAAVTFVGAAAGQDDKKTDKKAGKVTGVLLGKGENWVEVKADGEERPRRYVPHWVGGAPAQGGGPDKAMVRKIRELKLGSRLRLEWEFAERARVVKVEVLKEPEKGGTVTGTLTAKDNNGVEVKADGEEKPRRYALHYGGTEELRKAIKETAAGARVRVEWIFEERPRVLKMDVVKDK